MKKFLPIALFVLTFSNGYSQQYKKFRVGVGGGLNNLSGGANLLSMYIEPSFRIKDNITIGYKIEGALNLWTTIVSQSVTSQYYFLNSSSSFRPFIGAGVGIYNAAEGTGFDFMCDCATTIERNKIGFFPRAGFDLHHLTINFEYNWMTPFKETTRGMMPNTDPSAPPSISYFNANYFSAKVGVTIGGGKKRLKQTE